MNDNVTIGTFQLFKMFPDEESARVYLESRLWPDGVKCPVCSAEKDRITTRKNGYYRCNECSEDFTVRTGTIFERSHIPLHKWAYAMYLLVTARKGISLLQLSKEIGITQKSAWFMLHRLCLPINHRQRPRRRRSVSGNGENMASDLKDLEIKDRTICSCCGAPCSEWEYCDLCKPKICIEQGHDYIYDRPNGLHYCRRCDQEPPLDWYDIFAE